MKKLTMIKKLIVMPLGLRLDWPADYEVQTAKSLSLHNIVVMFAIGEGGTIRQFITRPFRLLTKETGSLYVFRPLYILPFQRLAPVIKINAWLAALQLRYVIYLHDYWKSLPKLYWSFSLQQVIQPRHFGRSYMSVYDCVDIVTPNALEQKIIRQSDVMLVNSESLYSLHKNAHPLIIKTGEGLFSLDTFAKFRLKQTPRDIAAIPKPRVVFMGNISNRLDFSLIYTLAEKTPGVSYVFIGNLDTNYLAQTNISLEQNISTLKKLSNIYFLDRKPKHLVPSYISASDLGFIPYNMRQIFNKYSSPMKIQEFFYIGKPVISTPIPEVKRLSPYATTFDTPEHGAEAIRRLLRRPWPGSYKRMQKHIATDNSITHKIELVSRRLHPYFPRHF